MKCLGLSLAIAAAMGLSGCGGSGGGSSASSPSSSSTVSGTASKGIVSAGLVEAFLFVNGEPDTSNSAIASSTTAANGTYSLSIPSIHEGKPLFIRISSTDATSMKCDIAGGCDADGDPATTNDITDFGASFDLSAGELTMSAVLPQATQTVAVNVTPLTTVAAELAKDAIATGASDNAIGVAISTANSQVSTTFGLGADITQIPVVDLTDADDVEANAGSNNAAINYAAINAAIVSAKQSDANGAGYPVDIGAAITQFAQEVVDDRGLIENAANDEDTSIADILAEAVKVIDTVEAEVTDEIEEDALDTQLSEAEAAPETTEGELEEPSDTAGLLGNYEKVKAFVEELRELGTAIDSSLVGEGEGAQTVETILDGFEDQIDAADMLSSTDAEGAIVALGDAMAAIIEVYEAEVEEIGVDTISAGNYDSPEGIAVAVEVAEGVTTFYVQETLEVDVDGEIIPAVTEITAVLTTLDFADDVTEFPGDQFTVANVPGSYTQQDGDLTSTVILNANNTGTFQDAGEDPGEIAWEVVDGVLEISWTDEQDVLNVDRYSFDSGPNVHSGNFTIEYLVNGQLQETYSASWRREGYDATESGSVSGEINFSVSGSISVGAVSLELNSGTVQASLVGSIDETRSGVEATYLVEYDNEVALTDLLLNLDAEISQTVGGEVVDPLAFAGAIDVSLSRVELSETGEYNASKRGPFSMTADSLGIFELVLEGRVSNAATEEFNIFFGLELNGTGVPAYTESFNKIYSSGSGLIDDKVGSSGGETEANFVGVSLDLRFDAELSGVTDALDVALIIERTAYDDASATLDLSYPGRDIEIVASATGLDTDNNADGEMTITNVNDGIVIFVDFDDSAATEDEEVSVEIRMDTNADNVVDEDDFLFAQKVTRNGIELIEYIDEDDEDNIEFESLF
jgi:trimeric autotransporter adhesin